MKPTAVVGCLILAGALLGPAGAVEEPVQEIRIQAKKYEYNPNEIRVRTGEHVRLVLTALDRTHGFGIDKLDIKKEIIKGQEIVVEFVAPEPGTYEFKCTKFCGFGHRGMKGKLIVEPAAGAQP